MDIPVKVSLYHTGAQPYKTLRYEIPNESASSVRDAALYGAGYAESGDRIVVWSGYRNEKLGTFKRGTVAGLPSVSRIVRKKKSNPRGTMKRAAKSKSRAASRWGVYVKTTLAYVSTNKLDANKAAAKLKASGRAFITIKAVNPNPITGKLPKIGWRDQFKKAAYAAMKTPKARRKMASRDVRTRQTRERRGKNPRQRKTRDEWQLWGNYGYGWDELVAEDTYKEIRQRLKEYRENSPEGSYKIKSVRVRLESNGVSRSKNAASILLRRANPKTAKKRTTTTAQRDRYMVQVGDTPAWVGKLKSDADKAWGKLTKAGHKAVKIFKVKVTKAVKDGWRQNFRRAALGWTDKNINERTGYKSNPSFPGRLGSGSRFRACVRKVSRQPGVYDSEGLCASIGRKKYGKKGMAKLAAGGRKRNSLERKKKGPYSSYSSAQEWGMKLRMQGHANIRIDKLSDGWWVYWTER